MSADGETLAVGARYESNKTIRINGDQNDNTAPGSGAVYVFTRGSDRWGQQAYLKGAYSQELIGSLASLSANGNTLIEAPDDAAMATCVLVVGASGAFSGGATTKLMTSSEATAAMEAAKTASASYKPATG